MLNPTLLHRFLLLFFLAVFALQIWSPLSVAQNPQRSPSDSVREFYNLMRERKFREAFALSIYHPAIEGLKPAEFDDLRPDFERLASAIPEKVNISGEQRI